MCCRPLGCTSKRPGARRRAKTIRHVFFSVSSGLKGLVLISGLSGEAAVIMLMRRDTFPLGPADVSTALHTGNHTMRPMLDAFHILRREREKNSLKMQHYLSPLESREE